ncbi:hypothetical protein [Paenibacillus cellulositrophicus]|uniref:hypothetical protein n=1 Tax=Paenibacillus cellulositrophicus TaxID=562959 RepID=UPI003D97863B
MKSIMTAFLLVVFILAGCSPEKDTFSSPLYQGRSLMIAVIGDATISYEDWPDMGPGFFVLGYDGGTRHQFGTGLYNDTKNETNAKSAYSDIFRQIETGL